jgi:hypothetical protein
MVISVVAGLLPKLKRPGVLAQPGPNEKTPLEGSRGRQCIRAPGWAPSVDLECMRRALEPAGRADK